MSTPSAVDQVKPEGQERFRWRRCGENALVKSGKGAIVGGLVSVILFTHPVTRGVITGFGAGTGAGISWMECRAAFNDKAFKLDSLRAVPGQLHDFGMRAKAYVDNLREGRGSPPAQ